MSREKQGRKPDYDLSALDKVTDMRGKVGAAWINTNGTISIRLNPWVVLDGANKELVITLFQVNNHSKKYEAIAADDRQDGFFVEGEDPPPY